MTANQTKIIATLCKLGAYSRSEASTLQMTDKRGIKSLIHLHIVGEHKGRYYLTHFGYQTARA